MAYRNNKIVFQRITVTIFLIKKKKVLFKALFLCCTWSTWQDSWMECESSRQPKANELIDILGGNGGSHWPDATFSEISVLLARQGE